jgi:hypothetical protein
MFTWMLVAAMMYLSLHFIAQLRLMEMQQISRSQLAYPVFFLKFLLCFIIGILLGNWKMIEIFKPLKQLDWHRIQLNLPLCAAFISVTAIGVIPSYYWAYWIGHSTKFLFLQTPETQIILSVVAGYLFTKIMSLRSVNL